MTGKTLFVSQLPYGRCENLTAVYDAYEGPKEFRYGVGSMCGAESEGFSVVVCDCLPATIHGKSRCKSVNIGHGITGDKTYGADEKWKPWFNEEAARQTDYAICPSEETMDILARQLCIPVERVLPLGMPRTDAYFAGKQGREGRTYLYAPTFRYENDGWLPRIDWQKVDDLLGDDEKLIVKRHYFTKNPITNGIVSFIGNGTSFISAGFKHISEVSPDEPCGKFVMGCDALVTDYSSIVYDAYLANVPSVLTVDDKDVYLRERGMYYDYPAFYSSRWLVAEGNEERLVEMLREAAVNGMGDVERSAIDHVAGACDGHSTERVCGLIKELVS